MLTAFLAMTGLSASSARAAIVTFTSTLTVIDAGEDSAAVSLGDRYFLMIALDESVADTDPSATGEFFPDALVGFSLTRAAANTGSWEPSPLSKDPNTGSITGSVVPDDPEGSPITYKVANVPSHGIVDIDTTGVFYDAASTSWKSTGVDSDLSMTIDDVGVSSGILHVRLLGTPFVAVPEPSVVALLAAAGACVGQWCRAQRDGYSGRREKKPECRFAPRRGSAPVVAERAFRNRLLS